MMSIYCFRSLYLMVVLWKGIVCDRSLDGYKGASVVSLSTSVHESIPRERIRMIKETLVYLFVLQTDAHFGFCFHFAKYLR